MTRFPSIAGFVAISALLGSGCLSAERQQYDSGGAADGTVNPDGILQGACPTYFMCALACNMGVACLNECAKTIGQEAADAGGPLVDCTVGKCPLDPSQVEATLACLYNDCPEQLKQCFPHGDKDCVQAWKCFGDKCPGDDTLTADCFAQCYAPASFEAQHLLVDLAYCGAEKCGDLPQGSTQFLQCQYEKCKVQASQCVPTGSADICKTAQCILSKCVLSQKQSCYLDCFTQATYEAQTVFLDVYACVEKECEPIRGTAEKKACEQTCKKPVNGQCTIKIP